MAIAERVRKAKEKQTKTKGQGLTEVQREAAIERFLNERLAGGRPFREAIEATGNRARARDAIARWTAFGWGLAEQLDEPALQADAAGLHVKVGVEPWGTEWHAPLEWDQIIDAAIDADAGAETWDVPALPTMERIENKERAKHAAKMSTGDKIAAARMNGELPADGVLTEQGLVAGDGAKQVGGKPRARGARGVPDTGSASLPTSSRPSISHAPQASSDPALAAAKEAVQLVRLECIEPNPYQPRQNFDEAKLTELAKSIETDGLLQPIAVRPKPRRGKPSAEEQLEGLGLLTPQASSLKPQAYQIVDGERRLRAIKILAARDPRFSRVPVIVRETTDREMAKLALVANDQREDLNPIERAQGYQRMVREHGLTQEELGASLGHSQAFVANAIRLLELPAEWQARVISREISPSHARDLVPHARRPAILKEIADTVKQQGVAPLKGWIADVRHAVRYVCVQLDNGARCEPKTYRRVGTFQPTPEQLAELDVIEVPREYGKGIERYAANTKLFDKLQAAYVKALPAAGEQRGGKKSGGAAAGGKEKKLTPAELKKKAAEQARIFADRLARWKILWLRWLIVEELGELDPTCTVFMRLAIYFSASSAAHDWRTFGKRERDFDKAITTLEHLPKSASRVRCWGPLAECAEAELAYVQRALVMAWLRFDPKSSDGPSTMFPDGGVPALAAHLEIDTLAAWREDLAGPLSQAYFELHTKEQLAGLGRELGVHVDEAKPKGVIVKQLLASPATKRKLPAELAPAAAKKKGKGKK
jgi:ParB/RepB/Spo0J family partition protein